MNKSATQTAQPSGKSVSPVRGILQRKCGSCGNHTIAGAECAECGKNKATLQRKVNNQNAPSASFSLPGIPVMQRKLTIGASNDPLEQEADSIADAVVAGGMAPFSASSAPIGRVQREDATKEKTNEEKYREGLEKLGDAFLKTSLGKELLEKIKQDTLVKGATELGKDFIGTLPGKIITGLAATGAVATLAATHKELPAQIPEIPLDVLMPGLSVQITYKGPVDKPTEAMISFKFAEQAPKGGGDKKPALSAAEKYRAETARMSAADAKFRAGMTYTPGSPEDLQQKAEQEAVKSTVAKYAGGPDINAMVKQYPWLAVPPPKAGLQLTMPKPSFGSQPPSLLGEEFKLKLPGEQKKKKGESRLQRKLSIGASNDPLEQEADRVADQVMAAPAHSVVSGAPPRIQRFTGGSSEQIDSPPASVDSVLASSGRPLDTTLQQDMGQRFGHDFSGVRVHSGAAAEQSARDVNAHAYTVGYNIVFGTGRFEPGTPEGRRLIAHELTHVVQQSSSDEIRVHQNSEKRSLSPTRPAVLQRKGGTIGGFFSNIGRSIASIFVDEPGYADATLHAYLKVLDDTNDIEDDFDSDDKARTVVKRWMASASGFALTQQQKVLLIKEMISGFTGDADEAAILNLLSASPDAEVTFILSKVTPEELRGEIHGEERDQLENILRGWTARTGPLAPRDAFAGSHAVTETQHANVEHVLNPTTVLVPPPPPPVGVVAPPPIVVDPPAMTGAGAGGTFETETLAMLNNNVGGWAANFRTLRAESGQPAFPVSSANRIADAAQAEAERYFSPYIRVASRGITDKYHPGAYSLTTKLGDESTRPLTDADRRGWMEYWMTLRAPDCYSAPCGQSILDSHHYLGRRDIAELRRVRDLYMASPPHVADIDDTIHSWPAEAGTGTVFIQPYQRIPNEDSKRTQRWQLFTTLIHEFMHVLMHPNFAAAANIVGGTARKILVEGFAEVMRTELWSGAGRLRSRLASTEMAPIREQVEGKRLDYKDSVVQDSGYYDQLSDAAKIDTTVGHENARTAFFLGHVELLGLGAGTRTEGGPLPGVAMYEPTDSPDAQVVVSVAGDTYAGLLAKSGASSGWLLDDTTGAPLPVGAAIAPGSRVRIPGIRWVPAIVNDTLGSVAQQHNVSLSALALANGFPVGAPAATPLITGRRILIPIHPNLP